MSATFDSVVFGGLSLDINAKLETQLISGTGVGEQLLGLLNISGINTVTFTSGAPTFAPCCCRCSGRRSPRREHSAATTSKLVDGAAPFAWIGTTLDTANSPVIPWGMASRDDAEQALGLPVIVDGLITAGTSADQLVACRPSDCLLYESPKRLRLMTEVLAGTLSVRIQVSQFAAAILNRYPSGISVVSGTGLSQPSGF